MKALVSLFTFLLAAPLTAEDPPGFTHWPSAALKSFEKKLAAKVGATKTAGETLARYDNHQVVVVHREASGESEVHQSLVDVFVVQSGEGTLVVGGKVVGGKSTAPGEIRGTAIEGGANRRLAPGDIAHIPANTPHQVLLEPGRQITYVIVKINSR
jgi:mannose-6-phosphate isomerase-like protein (cupin superfamily)